MRQGRHVAAMSTDGDRQRNYAEERTMPRRRRRPAKVSATERFLRLYMTKGQREYPVPTENDAANALRIGRFFLEIEAEEALLRERLVGLRFIG